MSTLLLKSKVLLILHRFIPLLITERTMRVLNVKMRDITPMCGCSRIA